ncbi:ArsR family transcriptional regulator [Nocardioides sp. Soil797]|nr:ArsR family transcriptional regulator [Nocardioides sp. Soil797]
MSNSLQARRGASVLDDLACCVPLAREPISVERATGVVSMLKAIADPTRLRLLSLVLSHEGGEACVCDLLPHFDLSQPTISHHLKVLHDAGLLDREKRATWVYYIARPEAMAAMASLFTTGNTTGSTTGADCASMTGARA